jgi:hypothetical protein
MNIYQKLNEVRAEFHQAKLKKSGQNKFAGYNYFELGDFIIPALEIFKKHGLTSVISFGKETADMRIVNVDKPEEVIVIESPMSSAALKGCHEVQNLGAVQTYLRRYLWVAALEIVEHDALDATTGKKGDGPVVTPRGNMGDNLDAEVKNYLADLAIQITDLVNENKAGEVKEFVNKENLDDEQYTYLWQQLGAPVRRAIKEAKK